MEKNDAYFIKLAIENAQKGMDAGTGGPFGAVIVNQAGEIVGQGCNKVTSSLDPTAHAEVVAIRDACSNLNDFQLEGCTIYSSCEPCPMCLGAIYWARPDRLVFACSKEDAAAIGFDDDFIYKEIELDYKDRKIKTEQMAQAEGIEVFKNWKAKINKEEY
ncbi:UNVERIFIED_CONTAM: hypothetical protein GTU68_039989 [Idotea baltica]|nr:hypothetical protein [Idotea baltica]